MRNIKLVAISGSLRKLSYNTAAIQALALLTPPYIKIQLAHIDGLPLFNPELEEGDITGLNELKTALRSADGLIIASPEYAHGISGPMKNALDWLVSGEEFPYKPVMLINTSPRAHHALDALREVLKTMSGVIIENAFVEIPLLSSGLDADGIANSKELSTALLRGLEIFCREIESLQARATED